MFDRIITVTLNPAIDATIWIDRFDLEEPVAAIKEKYYPGGKSINVSRVLTSLGVENSPIVISGTENQERFQKLLQKENVYPKFILTSGSVRENLSIVMPDQKMLKINKKGILLEKIAVKELVDAVKKQCSYAQKPLLVFAGSIPTGFTKQDFKDMILLFQNNHIKIVLDNDIFSLDDLKEIKPFIIKPNLVEFERLTNNKVNTLWDIKNIAYDMNEFCENILVSMGEKGLYYSSKECDMLINVPKVEVKSTIGAGDSTLAGFIYGLYHHMNIKESLIFAASCGTASVTLEGTQVIHKEQVEKVKEIVNRINC